MVDDLSDVNVLFRVSQMSSNADIFKSAPGQSRLHSRSYENDDKENDAC